MQRRSSFPAHGLADLAFAELLPEFGNDVLMREIVDEIAHSSSATERRRQPLLRGETLG